MKTILLWDPQGSGRDPVRLSVEDTIASAAVRAGVAAAADPADHAGLMVGGPIDAFPVVEAVVQHGARKAHRRLKLPRAVVAIGAALGLIAATGAWTPPATLPVNPPVGYAPPAEVFPFAIWRDAQGVVQTDWTRAAWAPTPDLLAEAQRVAYFVNGTTGSDASGVDGLTPATARRTISAAVALGNAQALPFIVYVQAGVYDRGMSPTGAAGTIVPNKACALIAVGGRVETGFFDQVTWTLDQGTTYRATRNSVRRVVNLSAPDSRGVYPDLTWVASLAACRATPGSWFTDNTTIYVNRADGAAVTFSNTRVFLTLAQAPLRMSTGGNMYVSGFDLQGNTPALIDGGVGYRFVGEDCSFRYSSGDDGIVTAATANHKDGVVIAGVNAAALIRCSADANQKDGINWRSSNSGANKPFVLTIDCVAIDNGRPNAVSCNGLTAHDGCGGLDIRGRYERNAGGQVAIVHAGTVLWCIDTACRASRGDVIHGGAVPPTDFLVDQDTPTLILDNCRSSESQISLYARSGRILTRGGSFAGETFTANGGTVEAYA